MFYTDGIQFSCDLHSFCYDSFLGLPGINECPVSVYKANIRSCQQKRCLLQLHIKGCGTSILYRKKDVKNEFSRV